MYTFDLSEKFLSTEEQKVFNQFLTKQNLDNKIWKVFETLFVCHTRYSRPMMVRAYLDSELFGAAIFIKCKRYGKALFRNPVIAGSLDLTGIPVYLWIRLGCCMDMISNPAFIRDPGKMEDLIPEMIQYMRKSKLLILVNDYTSRAFMYPEASVLPALPHGLIDTSGFTEIRDYSDTFKNIKKKIRSFGNKGGKYILVQRKLDRDQIKGLKKCFISTSEKSIFYLPYQDLYLKAATNISDTPVPEVYYFVALLNGQFLGYQAAIKTGKHLNALHGAFDRTRNTTFHAYDILFVKMVEFAISHGLETVDFGVILNRTKQKMVNRSVEMSYFIYSKYPIVQRFFNLFLKNTKIQGSKHMQFRKEAYNE